MSELDHDALKTALERGRLTEGSRLVGQLEANPEAIRTLARLALAHLPAGPAAGEDEAAWATLNEADPLVDMEVPAAQAVTPAAFAGPEVFAPMAPTLVRAPRSSKAGLWAMVAGLAVAAGVGATWWVMRSDPTPAAPVAAAPASSAPTSVAAASEAVAPASEAAAPASEAVASEAPASAAPESLALRTPRAGRPPRAGDGERVERVAPPAAPASLAVAAPATAAARKPGSEEVDDLLGGLDRKPAAGRPAGGGDFDPGLADDPLLPERLSRQQILMVVKQGAGRVNSCKAQDPNATGTVTVAMVIEPRGNVSSATVASGPFKGSPAGACVEEKVKSLKFPQFRGEPMRINMPFAL